MRLIMPTAFAALFAATLIAAPSPAAAARAQAPWCAVVQVGWGNLVTDCSFWTVEQCVPHVIGGNRGFCQENPAYEGPPPRKKTHRGRH